MSYVEPLRFCQQCGADMQRASAIELAARREGVSSDDVGARRAGSESEDTSAEARAQWASAADRRVSASAQTWLGRIVDGRYRVIEVIGRGGMGVVYKVEHIRMGKIAAMKVLHKDLAEDPDVVRRFEREAHAVSRLQHPNTVQVFDFGASQEALYLIMEYVRGQDLAHIIDRGGPLPFARAAPLLIQICGALGEAHELGIVHRDLKPENVLITRTTGGRDYAKVLDFGLAKLGAKEKDPDVTDRTQIVGTPYFMSPEQIRGDDVDARADVYSLGALTYTILTGHPPFTAKSAVGVLTKHLTAEVVVPSLAAPDQGLTDEIDAIVVRALAKDPDERWATVGDMASAIEQVYAEQVGDVSPHAMPRAARPSRQVSYGLAEDEPLSELRLRRADLDDYERSLRRRKVVVWAVTLVVMTAVAAALTWWLVLRPPQLYTAEAEPNDDDGHANAIAAGSDVTGYLGKRISRREGDRDVFQVDGAEGATRLVSARVSALPNVDIRLTLRDRRGSQIAVVDETPLGSGEALRRWRVAGPLFVEVAPSLRGNAAIPTENVSDPYTLTVNIDDEDAGWESEPNGNAPDAIAIVPGTALRGWLDSHNDVDVLRWDGDAGKVTVEVVADKTLPLSWRGPDGAPHPPGTQILTLERGSMIRLDRTDRGVEHEATLPGADAPWTVTITPAR